MFMRISMSGRRSQAGHAAARAGSTACTSIGPTLRTQRPAHARLLATLLVTLLTALLAGCANRLPTAAQRDGPAPNPPANLALVPDAVPRIEAVRLGGPNKPYSVLGRDYVPITQDLPVREQGLASWYGRQFQGLPTASGEIYDMHAMTAAHPTLPLPSYAWVRNPANGREVVVRINDRGPFHPGRIIDLSYTAALKLDLLRGVAPVELERITFDAIRSGRWRRGAPTAAPDSPDTSAPPVAPKTPSGVAPAEALTPADPVTAAPVSLAQTAKVSGPDAAPAPAGSGDTGTVAATPAAAPQPPAPGHWIQLGAFRQRDGAEQLQRRLASELAWLAPLLMLFDEAPWFRLRAGPYVSRSEARRAAQRMRSALSSAPLIVEH